MKILKESNEVAWMIRNDGKAFPVVQHYYANSDDVEETLYAAEWLFDHTNHDDTQDLILSLVSSWIQSETNAELNFESAKAIISSKPYKLLSVDFIRLNWEGICNAAECHDIKDICTKIETEVNQEFLRARFGGMYNTSSSSKELVFRISSTGFNWYDIIWEFVYKNRHRATSVTIVRDEESTGVSNYYKSPSGKLYNQIPLNEFITESGNPVVESYTLCVNSTSYSGRLSVVCEHLQKGHSVGSLSNINMNADRAHDAYMRLRYDENHTSLSLSEVGYE